MILGDFHILLSIQILIKNIMNCFSKPNRNMNSHYFVWHPKVALVISSVSYLEIFGLWQ